MAKIRVFQGPDLGRRFIELDKPQLVFGRFADCDVILPNPAVSRRHFKVMRQDDHWCVEDISTRGGIWVNDVQLVKGSLALADGDQIRVYDWVLVFIDDAPNAARQA